MRRLLPQIRHRLATVPLYLRLAVAMVCLFLLALMTLVSMPDGGGDEPTEPTEPTESTEAIYHAHEEVTRPVDERDDLAYQAEARFLLMPPRSSHPHKAPLILSTHHQHMNKTIIKRIQQRVGVTPDGVIGPATLKACSAYTGLQPMRCPTKSRIRSNMSIYGRAGRAPMVKITPPYQLTYLGKQIDTIAVHHLISPYVSRAMDKILDLYGQQRIHELGLDVYSGCYHLRKVRRGSCASMHSWAIALDWDAVHNADQARGAAARFTTADYDLWWIVWLSVGARPFGLFNDRDYMHLEFTFMPWG